MSVQDSRHLAALAEIECQVGDFGQAERRLDELVDAMLASPPGPTIQYSYPAMIIPLVAHTAGSASKFDAAEEAAEVILQDPSSNAPAVQAARVGLAFMAVSRRDAEAAAEH